MKSEKELWEEVMTNADHFNRLSEILKALAHPIALQSLYVMYNMPTTPTKLWTTLGLTKQDVGNRLNKLEELGVLNAEKAGRERIYCIRLKFVRKLFALIIDTISGSDENSVV